MRSKIGSTFAAAILGGLTLLMAIPASARTWTRQADGKTLEAAFVRFDGENMVLKLGDGREVTVPKAMFTKADTEAAEKFALIGDNTNTMKYAAGIDKLLAPNLIKAGLKSFNEPLPDDLFARRVYLDILGRIPTREEFQAFAESPRPEKRAELIDDLLLKPGRAHHLFNYFADMYRLHGNADFPQGVRFEPYIQWWKDSINENTPYNEMVMKMITAKGNLGHDPAAGFLLRDAGMEFDAFSNFGQVMLGIDISCAQCHDHPFDEWTMDDFYHMAAYFGQTQRTLASYQKDGGMGRSTAQMPGAPEGWKMQMDNFAKGKGLDLEDPQSSRQYRYFVSFLGWNLTDDEERVTPVPMNVEKIGGEVYKPRTLVGGAAKKGGKTLREAVSAWLVEPENPRFAMVIANRMWSRAFGRAIIEPVHDFPSEGWEKMSAQPEVLKALANIMKSVDYDLREFMRILYNTKAYQTIATYEEPSAARPYAFQGPVLRRMRAEQAWDSLMVLAHGAEVDDVRGRNGSFISSYLNVDFENDSMESIWEKYEAFSSIRGGRAGAAIVEEPGSLQTITADIPRLGNMELIRAAEMEQPAPGASLLDTFGQSDRMVTDDHVLDGSVPQVLALMNGAVTDYLTGSNSKVVQDLEVLDAPEDKVRAIYFTMLSRFPNDDEQGMGVEILDEYGDDGIRDLAWALMNSPEFLFIQ
ncbi:MAG: hypothetical protein ACI8UO_004589 [Verrucomicrobiales bacterium]|jgi:hypothetical protein